MGTPLKLKPTGGGPEREIELVNVSESRIAARIDGEEIAAHVATLPDGSAMLTFGEHRYRIAGKRRGTSLSVAAGPMSAEYQMVEAHRSARKGVLTSLTIDAPMPGTVLKILVEDGARVNINDPLIVLEAMKTETTLRTESPAVIKHVRVQLGQRVDHGAILIELSPDTAE